MNETPETKQAEALKKARDAAQTLTDGTESGNRHERRASAAKAKKTPARGSALGKQESATEGAAAKPPTPLDKANIRVEKIQQQYGQVQFGLGQLEEEKKAHLKAVEAIDRQIEDETFKLHQVRGALGVAQEAVKDLSE